MMLATLQFWDPLTHLSKPQEIYIQQGSLSIKLLMKELTTMKTKNQFLVSVEKFSKTLSAMHAMK